MPKTCRDTRTAKCEAGQWCLWSGHRQNCTGIRAFPWVDRRQSQRVKSADLTAFFSQYAIFANTLSNDGAHVFLCPDPIFASALIEVQTISFVTGTACVDRTPSITD